MTKEPTQEQKKEFWEWCIPESFKDIGCIYGEGLPLSIIINLLPPIDLNNLFKYARPAVIEKLGIGWWDAIIYQWKGRMYGIENINPPIELFEVISEVIHDKRGT